MGVALTRSLISLRLEDAESFRFCQLLNQRSLDMTCTAKTRITGMTDWFLRNLRPLRNLRSTFHPITRQTRKMPIPAKIVSSRFFQRQAITKANSPAHK